ncbi:MAG: hypothetical protein M3Y26_06735 [Actinomycetota bacterium]|nr:hypothetical protein [Actinomycetota bacterium]
MNVVGLDLSLTATGLARANGTFTLKTTKRGMDRLNWFRYYLAAEAQGADLVAIEGYAFGRPNQACHLGELGGVVRLELWRADIPYVDIPPATVKKYATGKGNASKGMVLEAASKRSGLDFAGDDNRADAWWLRALALDHYGEPVVSMPTVNRSALASVTWPELAEVMA